MTLTQTLYTVLIVALALLPQVLSLLIERYTETADDSESAA